MSCNGCRVLRKGCSESCILRPCLQWIETPEAQGHATVFVAKFFGRAGLMSFISAVPESQRPVLFQSLLFEACGRTVNPVNGAVGLLWTGNWQVCQAAVETVLRGGTLRPIPELVSGSGSGLTPDEASEADGTVCTDMWRLRDPTHNSGTSSRFTNSRSKTASCSPTTKRKRPDGESLKALQHADLDLRLTPTLAFRPKPKPDTRRPGSPSMNSEESVVTTCFESNGFAEQYPNPNGGVLGSEIKLLNLFP
ncbi:PREDICTED: LOB domain-containing protein 38 [Fragaria vesca subsp. vesca]|uniref:LOB domain-containing protein 38 n=1 Tax=Fragaria vesca subsp. vesca TaxID=101020 RepID=UPI0002C30F5E|nr:PREDICTED: LOB domain-containing protein 38 [Fragaria vesca subsp. vesca]